MFRLERGVAVIAGKHFSYMTFGGGSGAGNESGAYSVYFTDMVIIGANGEVHPLYTGQPSASVNYVGAANMTGLAESIGQSITNGESHFYLSDDLNSVRMVLGGWPLSESTYTPFGQVRAPKYFCRLS